MCWNPQCHNYGYNTVCPGCSPCNDGCSPGNHCNNFNTDGTRCNGENWENQCNETKRCGCPIFLGSSCSYYDGPITSCLGITTGTKLIDIIQKFDATFCTFTPSGTPSGCPIVVNGTTGQISVSQVGSGCGATYIVGLSPVITNDITILQAQIQSIGNFLLTTITNLTTNTPQWLSITNPSLNTWNIDYIQNPSGQSGIIYSDYSDSTTVNTSWTTLKTYTIAPSQLNTDGDKLVVNTRYITNNPSGTPFMRIQFNGVTLVAVLPFPKYPNTAKDCELWVVRTSNSTVDFILKVIEGSDNGVYYQTTAEGVSYLISMGGLNLSISSYPINIDALSATVGDLIVKFLEVEYKHKI